MSLKDGYQIRVHVIEGRQLRGTGLNSDLPNPVAKVNLEAGQINDKAAEVEDEEEDMEAENDENALPANIEVFAKQGKRQERKMEKEKEDNKNKKEDPLFKLEGNLRLDKRAKMLAKKNRKERRRGERVADTLSNQMENVFSQI